jgi:hypothetical protein
VTRTIKADPIVQTRDIFIQQYPLNFGLRAARPLIWRRTSYFRFRATLPQVPQARRLSFTSFAAFLPDGRSIEKPDAHPAIYYIYINPETQNSAFTIKSNGYSFGCLFAYYTFSVPVLELCSPNRLFQLLKLYPA